MYCWWFFLTACIYGIVAFRFEDEFEDLNNWRYDGGEASEEKYREERQESSTNTQSTPSVSIDGKNSKCMKDILLVVDASWSIQDDFGGNVIPFLKNLVNDSRLNVDFNGTWIGLVIFSEKDKTKKILDVGEIRDPGKLVEEINSKLDNPEVRGSFTRTDKALKIANKVFSLENPMNGRSDIDDVVILITDGAPTHETKKDIEVTEETKKNAQKLKDKDVLLIVAAVGSQRKNFTALMEELATSPDNVLEADFNNMTNIMSHLVESSCTEAAREAYCSCAYGCEPPIRTINSEGSAVEVDAPFPQPTCKHGAKIISKTSEPQLPHKFPAGIHEIKYTFFLENAMNKTLTCPLKVKVKVKCGREQYFPNRRTCCCGRTHKKKTGYECCGQDYYNPNIEKCCGDVNVVSFSESC